MATPPKRGRGRPPLTEAEKKKREKRAQKAKEEAAAKREKEREKKKQQMLNKRKSIRSQVSDFSPHVRGFHIDNPAQKADNRFILNAERGKVYAVF